MKEEGLLRGVKVLDLTRVLAGPYCSMILADMGADVIKIEAPGRGDDSRWNGPIFNGVSAYFMNLNRNKRGITLNLQSPKGKEIFIGLGVWIRTNLSSCMDERKSIENFD